MATGGRRKQALKRGKGRGEEETGSALQAGRQREAQAGAGAHVAYFGRSRCAWPQSRPRSSHGRLAVKVGYNSAARTLTAGLGQIPGGP
jgi:hypothetical protein